MGVLKGPRGLTPVLPPSTSPHCWFFSSSLLPSVGGNPLAGVGTHNSCPCHSWAQIYIASTELSDHLAAEHLFESGRKRTFAASRNDRKGHWCKQVFCFPPLAVDASFVAVAYAVAYASSAVELS